MCAGYLNAAQTFRVLHTIVAMSFADTSLFILTHAVYVSCRAMTDPTGVWHEIDDATTVLACAHPPDVLHEL